MSHEAISVGALNLWEHVRLRDLPAFVVSEAEAAAIRAVFHQQDEFAAAMELRRLFPGITNTTLARECARTIAGWRPLPRRLRPARLGADKTG